MMLFIIVLLLLLPHTTDDAEIRLSELSHLSQAHHFLRPAQEKFVSRLGIFCSLPSTQKFDGRLEEFLRTAERISSDGSTKWARKTPLSSGSFPSLFAIF